MQTIIIFLLIMAFTKVTIWGVPINNGFSVKFNPIFKEETVPKSFGALFAKVPQELTATSSIGTEALRKIFYPDMSKLRPGCSNQVVKLILPYRVAYEDFNSSLPEDMSTFINLPIMKQPFDNYKVLVATAPPQMKLNGAESEPMVIYIVFNEDSTNGSKPETIPSIYFVNKNKGQIDLRRKEKADPILVVDSNRTITGINSKAIAKYVNFRSKFAERLNYQMMNARKTIVRNSS